MPGPDHKQPSGCVVIPLSFSILPRLLSNPNLLIHACSGIQPGLGGTKSVTKDVMRAELLLATPFVKEVTVVTCGDEEEEGGKVSASDAPLAVQGLYDWATLVR